MSTSEFERLTSNYPLLSPEYESYIGVEKERGGEGWREAEDGWMEEIEG